MALPASADRILPSAVFFDLTGTLVSIRRRHEESLQLLPGLREAVNRLPRVPLFLVTNRSEVTQLAGDDGNADMEGIFAALHEHLGGRITAARCCPHPPGAGCPGHKPSPGLILDLAAAYAIDRAHAWYVGDTLEDRECARRAGIGQFHWAQTFFAPAAGRQRDGGYARNAGTRMRDEAGPGRFSSLIPHPSSLALRPATEADLPAIVRIYNEAIEERISTCDLEPVTVAARRPWFERFDARHPLHVAVGGEEVTGWSAILPYDPKPGYDGVVEHSVYVARAARGAGLGRRLLQHLLVTAMERGHRCLMGRIFRHNDRSLHLHRQLGFEEVGVLSRVALLDGRPADVVIMLREL